jgi:hypothetical protein
MKWEVMQDIGISKPLHETKDSGMNNMRYSQGPALSGMDFSRFLSIYLLKDGMIMLHIALAKAET